MTPESLTPRPSRYSLSEEDQLLVREYVQAIRVADIENQDEAHRLRVELAALRTNGASHVRMNHASHTSEE